MNINYKKHNIDPHIVSLKEDLKTEKKTLDCWQIVNETKPADSVTVREQGYRLSSDNYYVNRLMFVEQCSRLLGVIFAGGEYGVASSFLKLIEQKVTEKNIFDKEVIVFDDMMAIASEIVSKGYDAKIYLNCDKKLFEILSYGEQLNNPDAICALAVCYRDGIGTLANKEKANAYFEKAIKLGSVEAYFSKMKSLSEADKKNKEGEIFKLGVECKAFLEKEVLSGKLGSIKKLIAYFNSYGGISILADELGKIDCTDEKKALSDFRIIMKVADYDFSKTSELEFDEIVNEFKSLSFECSPELIDFYTLTKKCLHEQSKFTYEDVEKLVCLQYTVYKSNAIAAVYYSVLFKRVYSIFKQNSECSEDIIEVLLSLNTELRGPAGGGLTVFEEYELVRKNALKCNLSALKALRFLIRQNGERGIGKIHKDTFPEVTLPYIDKLIKGAEETGRVEAAGVDQLFFILDFDYENSSIEDYQKLEALCVGNCCKKRENSIRLEKLFRLSRDTMSVRDMHSLVLDVAQQLLCDREKKIMQALESRANRMRSGEAYISCAYLANYLSGVENEYREKAIEYYYEASHLVKGGVDHEFECEDYLGKKTRFTIRSELKELSRQKPIPALMKHIIDSIPHYAGFSKDMGDDIGFLMNLGQKINSEDDYKKLLSLRKKYNYFNRRDILDDQWNNARNDMSVSTLIEYVSLHDASLEQDRLAQCYEILSEKILSLEVKNLDQLLKVVGYYESTKQTIVDKDKKLFRLYEACGAMGHAESLRKLGGYYFRSAGPVRCDFKKSYACFKKAAELGDEKALEALARCYEKGIGVSKCNYIAHALRQLKKKEIKNLKELNEVLNNLFYAHSFSYHSANVEEIKRYSNILKSPYYGCKDEGMISRASYEIKWQSEKNSLSVLDLYKLHNLCIRQDDRRRASEIFELVKEKAEIAYELGCMSGLVALGALCEDVDDYEKAIELYEKAALNGYPDAKLCLARMYFYGRGVAVDKAKAGKLIKQVVRKSMKPNSDIMPFDMPFADVFFNIYCRLEEASGAVLDHAPTTKEFKSAIRKFKKDMGIKRIRDVFNKSKPYSVEMMNAFFLDPVIGSYLARKDIKINELKGPIYKSKYEEAIYEEAFNTGDLVIPFRSQPVRDPQKGGVFLQGATERVCKDVKLQLERMLLNNSSHYEGIELDEAPSRKAAEIGMDLLNIESSGQNLSNFKGPYRLKVYRMGEDRHNHCVAACIDNETNKVKCVLYLNSWHAEWYKKEFENKLNSALGVGQKFNVIDCTTGAQYHESDTNCFIYANVFMKLIMDLWAEPSGSLKKALEVYGEKTKKADEAIEQMVSEGLKSCLPQYYDKRHYSEKSPEKYESVYTTKAWGGEEGIYAFQLEARWNLGRLNIENRIKEAHEFANAFVVKEDVNKLSYGLYRAAAERGDTKAMVRLGDMLSENIKGKSKEKAIWYYEMAALKGDALAIYRLGGLEEDKGNLAKAEEFYLKAVNKGETRAIGRLAELYLKRDNLSKANEWARKGIDRGIIDPCLRIFIKTLQIGFKGSHKISQVQLSFFEKLLKEKASGDQVRYAIFMTFFDYTTASYEDLIKLETAIELSKYKPARADMTIKRLKLEVEWSQSRDSMSHGLMIDLFNEWKNNDELERLYSAVKELQKVDSQGELSFNKAYALVLCHKRGLGVKKDKEKALSVCKKYACIYGDELLLNELCNLYVKVDRLRKPVGKCVYWGAVHFLRSKKDKKPTGKSSKEHYSDIVQKAIWFSDFDISAASKEDFDKAFKVFDDLDCASDSPSFYDKFYYGYKWRFESQKMSSKDLYFLLKATYGVDKKRDNDILVALQKRSITGSNPMADYYLYEMYCSGMVVSENRKIAYEYLKKAVANEDVKAPEDLRNAFSRINKRLLGSSKVDYKKSAPSVEEFNQAVERFMRDFNLQSIQELVNEGSYLFNERLNAFFLDPVMGAYLARREIALGDNKQPIIESQYEKDLYISLAKKSYMNHGVKTRLKMDLPDYLFTKGVSGLYDFEVNQYSQRIAKKFSKDKRFDDVVVHKDILGIRNSKEIRNLLLSLEDKSDFTPIKEGHRKELHLVRMSPDAPVGEGHAYRLAFVYDRFERNVDCILLINSWDDSEYNQKQLEYINPEFAERKFNVINCNHQLQIDSNDYNCGVYSEELIRGIVNAWADEELEVKEKLSNYVAGKSDDVEIGQVVLEGMKKHLPEFYQKSTKPKTKYAVSDYEKKEWHGQGGLRETMVKSRWNIGRLDVKEKIKKAQEMAQAFKGK